MLKVVANVAMVILCQTLHQLSECVADHLLTVSRLPLPCSLPAQLPWLLSTVLFHTEASKVAALLALPAAIM